MAEIAISAMTAASALGGTELLEVVQGGTNKKLTPLQVLTYILASSELSTHLGQYLAAQDVEVFKGAIDCSANPNYPAASAGHVYRVSVAGRIGGASGPKVEINDRMECFVDSSASGDHATVGANWLVSQVNTDGAVVGPVSATDNRLAVYDGPSGKIIKDGGILVSEIPTGQTTVGLALLQLTNPSAIRFLRINADNTVSVRTAGEIVSDMGARAPSIQAVTSSATVTPTFLDDMVKITAQAADLTLANPTGTAIPGFGMVIRIKDNGTARSITFGSQYRAIGVTLPATTVISKTLYLAMIYNNDDTKWDVVAVGQEV